MKNAIWKESISITDSNFPQLRLNFLTKNIILLKLQDIPGGETASTGIKKLRLHVELYCPLVKRWELNIIADDYNYAVAA